SESELNSGWTLVTPSEIMPEFFSDLLLWNYFHVTFLMTFFPSFFTLIFLSSFFMLHFICNMI
ncbi:hypothetical protein, partial [Citrobacter freundii]|uniref:hypothetical protein n=1 Tax=Citrobacter freundii TaxID=546 RepID=UPI001C433868